MGPQVTKFVGTCQILTPLFLSASGVILKVGGMLQHGALVAREYGKSCVSGLENATEILKDGQMVEMDGASGIVRLNMSGTVTTGCTDWLRPAILKVEGMKNA